MSKYVTQENLKEITKSISEIFNIKLHRVRHKIAINEGFKNHEAHIKSLPSREPSIVEIIPETPLKEYSQIIKDIQEEGDYYNSLSYDNLYTSVFDIVFGSIASNIKLLNEKRLINVELNSVYEMITVSTQSDLINVEGFDGEDKMEFFKNYFTGDTYKYNKRSIEDEIPKNLYFHKNGESSFQRLFFANAVSSFLNFRYQDEEFIYKLKYEDGILVSELKEENIEGDSLTEIIVQINDKIADFSERKNFSSKEMKEIVCSFADFNEHIDIIFKEDKGIKPKRIEGTHISQLFTRIFREQDIMNMSFIKSAPLKDSVDSVKVCFYDTGKEEPFECYSAVNDVVVSNGTHVRGLEEFLKKHAKKDIYSFNEDLSGVKAVLILNTNKLNYDPYHEEHMSTIDRQSEYFVKLFESDPEGTNMFFDSPKVASNFQDNDEDAPLNLTPDINAIFEMMHKKN